VGEKKMTDDELRGLVASLALAQVKTDAQLAKTDAQLAKTDAQLAKTDAQLAKTDAKLNKLAEMYGGVGNNQGRVTEEFYYNSLKHNPVLNGIQFDFIEKNVTRSKGGIEEEYDLLLVNGQEIYIVEVKYRLHPKDIERMVGRKLTNFKKLFPEYQNYRIHLALATFAVEDDVKQLALDNGVTLLQRRGDVIETLAA
jgi:Holliday junction resolvase-like predicted endonuclease